VNPQTLLLGALFLGVLLVGGLVWAKRGAADSASPGSGVIRMGGGRSVAVNVDPIRCARFGFCEHEAPDVFQIRREGRLTYKSRVKEENLTPVIRALEVCPARAIFLGKMS
jgi:sulfoxide reductase heme-binding subunit YedZ